MLCAKARLGVNVVTHFGDLEASCCARESCGRMVVVCFGFLERVMRYNDGLLGI